MSEKEEYSFIYRNRHIKIKTGRKEDVNGDMMYYAIANFKNVLALAECGEAALEKCVKKIKFAIARADKNITLMNQKKATALAKRHFEENFSDKDLIKKVISLLCYCTGVEDEIFVFHIMVSDPHTTDGNEKMRVLAIVYVNLLTGECDMLENRTNIKEIQLWE